MNSNPAQAEAIRHGEGPMLVLAGPGSGKTHVIIGRVRHLIEQHNVLPENILVITFSKAAATEMRERFLNGSGNSYPGVTFGTFHSCFFHILQIAYNLNPASIIREETARTIFRDILTELQPELAEQPEMIASIREEIQKYKGTHSVGNPARDEEYEPLSCKRELFYPVLRAYLEAMRSRGMVDFEDMLTMTRELFQKRPDILAFWQERYRYILIDEFQDVNPLQYEIVKMLAARSHNLFAVGDDDQAIYGFRGATPGIMLRFTTDYPDAKVVTLNVNYRCSEEILRASSDLISCNTERFQKALLSNRGSTGPVRIQCFDDTGAEYADIIKDIRTLLQNGEQPEHIAVLFRTNLEMRSLIHQLEQAGIPYCCRVLPPLLYSGSYVLPVLSYLRIAAGSMRRSDWLMIANRPVRYVERSAFPEKEVSLTQTYTILHSKGKDYVVERLQKLELDLKRISGMNPYAAIHFIRHIIGYNRHLSDTLPNAEEAMDLLDEVMKEAADFRTINAFLEHADSEDARRRANREAALVRPGITLQTFHASKGLEYRHVFICNCNELVTPHKKALLPEQIAEERRLFYVAMTRAIVSLKLCYVKKNLSHDAQPSRFLGEIRLPQHALAAGVAVYHDKYGTGIIQAVSEKEIRVHFPKHLLPKAFPLAACRQSGELILASLKEEPQAPTVPSSPG